MEEPAARLTFGDDAEGYDRIKPSYPTELIDDLVALVGTTATAVDVGCGTAKATVLLADRGLHGVGVEPDERMAAVARRRLERHLGWRVDVVDFEEWEPGPVPFDLVCSAQAWHWVDPEVRLEKAGAVLRSGGWAAAWWNQRDDDASPLRRAIEAVYDDIAPQMRAQPVPMVTGQGARARAAQARFEAPLQRDYHWSQSYTTAEWADHLRTQSWEWALTPEQMERVTAAVSAVIDAHGGLYTHRYVCRVWMQQRK